MLLDFLHYAGSFFIVISVIVFIHEFGHYFIAKLCGVKIVTFSIGMGKEVFGFTDRSGTRWKLAALPIGGYVKMYGDATAASTADVDKLALMSEEEKKVSFHFKKLPQKAAIVSAGPIANFILSISILTYMIFTSGMPSTEPVIGEVMLDTPAYEAGLKKGDRILSLDGNEMDRFNDIPIYLSTNLGTPVVIDLERGGEHKSITITPRYVEDDDGLGNKITRPVIGIRSTEIKIEDVGFFRAVWEATDRTYVICATTLHAVGQIVTGDRSVKDLKSPLGIAKLSGQATEIGFSTTLWLIALLSANLGLINLFPIPILDGGHLAYYTAEALRGRPMAERVQDWGNRLGFAFIMTLLAVTLYNDVVTILFLIFKYFYSIPYADDNPRIRLPVTYRHLLITTSLTAALCAGPLSISSAQTLEAPTAVLGTADEIQSVRVEGNERIEARTILSYMNIRQGETFDQRSVSKAMKDLFATGFFSDVKLLRAGNTLVVRVVENPVINQVAFEGNDDINAEDLEKEIQLKSREIYTKTKLQNDVKRILDIYRRKGRYTATVDPKIIQKDQNRIDLVYEINEGAVARIEKISFVGNNKFSGGDLRSVIRSSENEWYQFLTDDDKYDPDRLQYDQELLRRYYTSQGYADFQVKSAHAELSPNKDAFYVTFVVDEGPQYNFGDIKVDSKLKSYETLDFSNVITTKSGKEYDGTAVESSIDSITQELGNYGYAFVEVSPKLARNRDTNTIDLTYLIRPGPKVYVERINITGNSRTLDEVIRREFRVAEGDPYNSDKLTRTEQRLNNLNFFEKVTVANEPGSAPDRTVVNVDVQEKSTGEINFGAGFSSTDGPLADFGIRESNLLGRGQELKTRVTFSDRRKQIELGFTEPYFLNRELSAGFDVYRTSFDYLSESSYALDAQGLNLRMGYNIRERLQHSFNYMLRDNDINDIQPFASRFIFAQQGRHINSAIGHALIYDDRNSRLNPTSGYYLKLGQELAGLGGDSRYLKHEIRTSYYYPISKDWTWSVLGAGGHILGLGGRDIFISDRFFIGGELIHGFDNSGIGARDVNTQDALGGNMYYAASTELRFPLGLPEDLGFMGAVYADVGSLWDVDDVGPDVHNGDGLRFSLGFGLSWASPFGPIRIDISHPIIKEPYDVKETFRFSFGTRF